jgi:hypothetical protein
MPLHWQRCTTASHILLTFLFFYVMERRNVAIGLIDNIYDCSTDFATESTKRRLIIPSFVQVDFTLVSSVLPLH